jgi:hypothetical protein
MNEPDDHHLIELIRSSSDDTRIDLPDQSRVIQAGRRRRRKDRLLASGASVAIALGLVIPLWALMPFGQDADRRPNIGSSAELPTEVALTCQGAQAELADDAVQPLSDGAHLRITYEGGTRAVAIWKRVDEHPVSYWATNLDPSERATSKAFTIEPGEYYVSCLTSGDDHDIWKLGPDDAASLDVVDVAGVWSSDRLQCPANGFDIGPIDSPGGVDATLIAAELRGVRDSDVVVEVGYPDAPRRQYEWGVERDGDLVAVIAVFDGGTTSALFGAACSGSGIGGGGSSVPSS